MRDAIGRTSEECRQDSMRERILPVAHELLERLPESEGVIVAVRQLWDDSAHDTVDVVLCATPELAWPPPVAIGSRLYHCRCLSTEKDEHGTFPFIAFASYCMPFGSLRYDVNYGEAFAPYAFLRPSNNPDTEELQVEVVAGLRQPHWEGRFEWGDSGWIYSLPRPDAEGFEGYDRLAETTLEQVPREQFDPSTVIDALKAPIELPRWERAQTELEMALLDMRSGKMEPEAFYQLAAEVYWAAVVRGIKHDDRHPYTDPGVTGVRAMLEAPISLEGVEKVDFKQCLADLFRLWNLQENLAIRVGNGFRWARSG